MISADRTVVNDDIPGPECNGVPLRESVSQNHSTREKEDQGIQHAFLTSNLFFPSAPSAPFEALAFAGAAPASFISTSAIILE